MKTHLKNATPLLLALLVGGLTHNAPAQSTNKTAPNRNSATQKQEPATGEKKPSAGPFHGKLAALDKTARTIKVGKRTFQITSETKIKRAGKPATLDDAIVGEEISGYNKPADDGKLIATTVNLGPKSPTKPSAKK